MLFFLFVLGFFLTFFLLFGSKKILIFGKFNNDNIDDELKEKLKKLDYDSDDKEEINRDNKDQKQK